MSTATQKLSVKEKIGYSLGDLAANLVFQTLMMFITLFYTDVYGLSPAHAGTILLVCGILFGGIFNVLMGYIADRTETKWGKFRPWILWTAIPFGVIAYLSFVTPDFDYTGKLIYATVMYSLLVIIYTANNLPYSALSGVMTGDMVERTSLSSYRFVAVMVAQFMVQVMMWPLAKSLGNGDQQVGFQYTMLIFAIIAIFCFLITFLTTKERVKSVQKEQTPFSVDFGDLMKNVPWLVVFAVTFLQFITLAMRGGQLAYYFKDFLSESSLSTFIQGLGLGEMMSSDPATFAFSVCNGIGIIATLIGIGFSKSLAQKYGKRDVFKFFFIIATIFMIAFVFIGPESITAVFVCQFLHGLFFGVTVPLLWAMIADVADYSEWKNNRRATAIIFSAMIFGLKVGLSIGGAIGGFLLSYYGYDSSLTEQRSETTDGIKLMVSIYPAIPFLIGWVLLFFYKIDKKMEYQIQDELNARRAAAGMEA